MAEPCHCATRNNKQCRKRRLGSNFEHLFEKPGCTTAKQRRDLVHAVIHQVLFQCMTTCKRCAAAFPFSVQVMLFLVLHASWKPFAYSTYLNVYNADFFFFGGERSFMERRLPYRLADWRLLTLQLSRFVPCHLVFRFVSLSHWALRKLPLNASVPHPLNSLQLLTISCYSYTFVMLGLF